MLTKVISGGQTGVDQAALRAAKACGIPTGGWAPKGWKTEAGPAPWLADYGLVEYQGDYAARTRANVAASGFTLILIQYESDMAGGTRYTRDLADAAAKHGTNDKTVYRITCPENVDYCRNLLRLWTQNKGLSVLNIAGPRESKSPGIGEMAEKFLREVFTEKAS